MFKKILASVLTLIMLLSVVPVSAMAATSTGTYLIDDNDVRWYYNYTGWAFIAGYNYGYYPNYSDSLSDYVEIYGDEPVRGTAWSDEQPVAIYTYDSEDETWNFYASVGTSAGSGIMPGMPGMGMYPGISVPGMGMMPGMGMTPSTFIVDNRYVQWVYYGDWKYVKNFMGAYGSVDDYYDQYGEYPSSGYLTDADGQMLGYYTFNEEEKDWKYNMMGGMIPGMGTPGMGIPGMGMTASTFIVDNRMVQWVYYGEWKYLKNYMGVYGSVDDYYDQYGEYPTSGRLTNSDGEILGYYTFDEDEGEWNYNMMGGMIPGAGTFPGIGDIGSILPGIGGLTSTLSYIMDTNDVKWILSGDTWYFYQGNNAYPYYYYSSYVGSIPTYGTGYSVYGTSNGTYVFNGSSWTQLGSSSGSIGTGSGAIGAVTNPNNVNAVYDTNNKLWTKNSSGYWTSSAANSYSYSNPARYIDAQNRVWEMYDGEWILNKYATGTGSGTGTGTGTATGTTNPNNLSYLTDTKGYTWTKSGSTWSTTTTAKNYYSRNNLTPQYKASNGTVYYLSNNVWTTTAPSTGSSTGSSTLIGSDYATFVIDGKSYVIPIATVKMDPTSLVNIPNGYYWSNIYGSYELRNPYGQTYPLITFYQLPNGYYYYPTGNSDYPWAVGGTGSYATSIINHIEFTDYPWKLEIGKTYQMKVDYETDGTDTGLNTIIIWHSSDPSVATVDQNGLVTIVGEGRADITARAFLGTAETMIDIYGEKSKTSTTTPSTPSNPGTTKPVDPTPSTPVTPQPTTTPVHEIFNDINKNAWYAEDVQTVYDWKNSSGTRVMGGVTNVEFRPVETLNRAQFALMLARMADVDLSKYKTVEFSDVKITDWYGPAVAWASAEGIISGVGDMLQEDGTWLKNCFNPAGTLSREQACTILMRYAINFAGKNIPLDYKSISYADAANVTSWAQLYVSYCEQLGFIDEHLLDNNKFSPTDPITRAEVASILARYAERFGK